jgi:outer membrane protein assembly factor BamB
VVDYPATSPNVLAVGGTDLYISDVAGDYQSEMGWSGSGGGISQYEPQPPYQSGLAIHSGGTVINPNGKRTGPDVAYNAGFGVSVYDSYNNGTTTPWSNLGGTSAGAPQWSALIALADQNRVLNGLASLDGPSQTLPLLYSLPSSAFHDITSGSNAGYSAGPGYDLVTGRGSPVAPQVVAGLTDLLSSWPMFHHDAQHTGMASPIQGTGAVGDKKWTFMTGDTDPVDSSPSLSPDGKIVYIGGLDGNLYALDAKSGKKVWVATLGERIDSSPAVSPDGKAVYIGVTLSENSGRIQALNAESGEVLWTYKTSAMVTSSPTLSSDGKTVYVGAWDGTIFALDAATGAELWSEDLSEGEGIRARVFSSPALSPDGKILFIGNSNGMMYAISTVENGEIIWSKELGGGLSDSPAVSANGKVVYVGSTNNNVYALNAKSGKVLWMCQTSGPVYSSPAISPDGKTIYVGSDDGKLYAINAKTGKVSFSFTTKGSIVSSPAVSEDGRTVYVGSDDGNFYAIEVATGQARFVYATGVRIDSSPAIGPDGSIYFGGKKGAIFAIE